MKKNLTLVLVALATVSTLGAYTYKFPNPTTGVVKFKVRYLGQSAISCRPDEFEVSPQHQHEVDSAGCSLKSVTATVYESLVGGEHVEGLKKERKVKAKPYKARLGVPHSEEFAIYGPVNGKYNVTRVVQ